MTTIFVIRSQRGEGGARPGFFQGVATVVTKLLNIVQPNVTFFGQKDGQQCCVVEQLVRDLNVPTEVCLCGNMNEINR